MIALIHLHFCARVWKMFDFVYQFCNFKNGTLCDQTNHFSMMQATNLFMRHKPWIARNCQWHGTFCTFAQVWVQGWVSPFNHLLQALPYCWNYQWMNPGLRTYWPFYSPLTTLYAQIFINWILRLSPEKQVKLNWIFSWKLRHALGPKPCHWAKSSLYVL